MNIIIGKYTLVPSDISPDRWDIIEKVTRNKKVDEGEQQETYEGENQLGFSMQLETCLKKILGEKLSSIEKDVDLKEYLREYKREKEELVKIFEESFKIL